MEKPVTTLFMLMSVDGKISTGNIDDRDVDKDFPRITGIKEGLKQYYDIEQTTDLFSMNRGEFMGKPLIAEKEVVLKYNIKTIWNIVVNNNDYKWRTDIKKIEILENGKDWIEYYDENGKFFTSFTLKSKEEYTLYSFDIENKNFYGNWTGKFVEINNNETKCIFTETIYVKNKIMNLLAKFFWNIEKIQEQYFKDLENKLNVKGEYFHR